MHNFNAETFIDMYIRPLTAKQLYSANTAERIEVLIGAITHGDLRNIVLDRSPKTSTAWK